MAIDHVLQRGQEGIEPVAGLERQYAPRQIGVALVLQQVMKEDAFLQRRETVNVLHVGGGARHAGNDRIELRLIQIGQRQFGQIVRGLRFGHSCRQRLQRRLDEDVADRQRKPSFP